MKLSLTRPATIMTTKDKVRRAYAWFLNWEFYLIVLLAGFLRFYRVDTSDFDGDQGLMYRMAYDAVHHGLLPVTNGTASPGFANAPGLLYLLMLPAAFSADPLYGVLLTSFLATMAVAITYIFTNRYYGRVAALVATLLYTTATTPLFYSRFLWQPNMMHPFVILFMFCLFGAVVERRKGWLAPALVLLAILYQAHGTTLLLLAPLALTILFAPETLRWRDIFYSLIGLALIFFPFLLWHLFTNFHDFTLILQKSTQPATINTDSLRFYRYMLSPFDHDNPPTDARSFVKALMPYQIAWLFTIMFYVVITAAALAIGSVIFQWLQKWRKINMLPKSGQRFWARLAPTPQGAGLLLLCAWQIVPVLALIKHSTWVFPHYLLVVLPGPFILIGYLVSTLSNWIGRIRFISRTSTISRALSKLLHLVLYTATMIVIIGQLASSTATILDQGHGYFNDRSNGQYYNDLYSVQLALNTADQLATQHHFKRVFIATDFSTETTMFYLGEHMQHPTTVFSHEHCLVLPSLADGPAILVMAPYARIGTPLAQAYGAIQLTQSPRLGGEPFTIYELPSDPIKATLTPQAFGQSLQAVGNGQLHSFKSSTWIISDWQQLQPQGASYNTTYNDHFQATSPATQNLKLDSTCTFNTINTGDHILAAFKLPTSILPPQSLAIGIATNKETPENPTYGPFSLETHRHLKGPAVRLLTGDRKNTINLAIS